MELIRGLHNLPPKPSGCVLTIGNFDGVHRGHRAVIGQLEQAAQRYGLPMVLMSFEPQPQEVFQHDAPPARLSRLSEKLSLLAATPLQRVVVLRFDQHLAATSPQHFVDHILVERLGIRHLVIGDDFRFGYRGQGDIALLREAGQRHGFAVERQTTFTVDGERVSSTRIRHALAAGDLDEAERLLGYRYRIDGRVRHGDRLGRTLGFPTANIALQRRVVALRGVFAAWIHGIGDLPRPAMANLGTRPTVNGLRCQLEAHLFDFQGDLYGQRLRVEFVQKIRDEQRFSSVASLTTQLQQDAAAARQCLESTPESPP